MFDMEFLENVEINNGTSYTTGKKYCVRGAVMTSMGFDFHSHLNQVSDIQKFRDEKFPVGLDAELVDIEQQLLDNTYPSRRAEDRGALYNQISPENAKRLMLEVVKKYLVS